MLHDKTSYKYNECFYVFGIQVFELHDNLCLHLIFVAGLFSLYRRLFTKHFSVCIVKVHTNTRCVFMYSVFEYSWNMITYAYADAYI